MKNQIIMSELEKLVAKNVITPGTLEKIKEYYEEEKRNSKGLSVYLTIIGMVMISLGIILLFAYNWSYLSRSIKTSLVLLLLIFSQSLFGYSLLKEKKWTAGAGVMVFAMSGLSIALISQMYNISGSDTGYYMTWVMINIPTLYLCRSKIIGIPYAIIAFLYLTSGGNIIVYLLLMIPAILLNAQDEKHNKLGEILIKIMLLTGVFYWYEGLNSGSKYYILFYTGVFTLLYLWSTSLKKAAAFILLLIAYIQTIDGGYISLKEFEFTVKAFLSWGVYLGAVGSLVYLKRWKDPINCFALLIVPAYFLGVEELVCNLYLFILGLYYMWIGVNSNIVKTFNKGSFLVSLIVISRFLDYSISTLFRAIVFIVIGIVFIIGNRIMSRREL